MIITLDVSIKCKNIMQPKLKKSSQFFSEETDLSTFREENKFAHKIQLEVKEVSESARKI